MDIRIDRKELEKQLFEEKENEEGSLVIKICVPEVKEENFKKSGLTKLETLCIVKGNNVNSMTEAVALAALDSISKDINDNPLTAAAYLLIKKLGRLEQNRYDLKGDDDDEQYNA